jgi:hypothetical protein
VNLLTLSYLAIREDDGDRSAAARKAWDTRGRGKKSDSPLGQSPPKNVKPPEPAGKPDSWQVGHSSFNFIATVIRNNPVTNQKDSFHVFKQKSVHNTTLEIDYNLPNQNAIHYMNQISTFQANGFEVNVKLYDERADRTEYGGEQDLAGVWESGQNSIRIFNATNPHMMNETIHHELMHAVFDAWREAVAEIGSLNKNDPTAEAQFEEFTDFIKHVDYTLKPNDLTGYLASYFKGGINFKSRKKSRYTETLAAMAQIERSPEPRHQYQWQRFTQKYPNLTQIYYSVRDKYG